MHRSSPARRKDLAVGGLFLSRTCSALVVFRSDFSGSGTVSTIVRREGRKGGGRGRSAHKRFSWDAAGRSTRSKNATLLTCLPGLRIRRQRDLHDLMFILLCNANTICVRKYVHSCCLEQHKPIRQKQPRGGMGPALQFPLSSSETHL